MSQGDEVDSFQPIVRAGWLKAQCTWRKLVTSGHILLNAND